jgi:membrane protein
MNNKVKEIISLIKRSIKKFNVDEPVRMASSTAFFTMFAMAPIIIIIISAVGLVMEEETIRNKAYEELQALIGQQGTGYIKTLVSNFRGTERNIIGTIIGLVIFFLASTTFFIVVQKTLNHIWRIRAKPSHDFLKTLKDRVLSLGLILSLGFILLVSLLVDAGMSILNDFLMRNLPEFTVVIMTIANYLLSFAVVTLIFAMIYKFLPDAIIKWRVVWMGALITAALFTAGKFLIGFLLGSSNIGVMYGAAGSLVIILLWVFYSSMIFYLGAEITQQYAETYSRGITPKQNAVSIEIKELPKE